MLKHLKFVAILTALALSIVATTGNAFAQTTSCDTSGSVSGTATPAVGTIGTTVNFMATGFTTGEDVSFWFTLPDGTVVGTAQPLPGGVNADGSIGPLPFTVTQEIVNLATGRWAITFQGASSNHQAVIYFCVLTVADATAVAQPTSPPATATTAATAAPSETAVPATAEATAQSTVEATATGAPAATALPTEASVPTAAIPTAAPVEATATTVVLPVATEVTPGMPTTGNSGDTFLGVLAVIAVALSAITLGWLARRNAVR